MPLSDISDPVVREVRRIRQRQQRNEIATIVLFVILVLCMGVALYLRSNDLEQETIKANSEQVRTCFRSANQRQSLRRLADDISLSVTLRDYVRATIVNIPTVTECKELADQLDVPLPEVIR